MSWSRSSSYLVVGIALISVSAVSACEPVKTSGTGSGSYSNAKANDKPVKSLDQGKKKPGDMCFLSGTTTKGPNGSTLRCQRVKGNLKWVTSAKGKPITNKFKNDSQPKKKHD